LRHHCSKVQNLVLHPPPSVEGKCGIAGRREIINASELNEPDHEPENEKCEEEDASDDDHLSCPV
jgi:hypothetical protein